MTVVDPLLGPDGLLDNAYGSEEVEHYASESPTMVSDHCLELIGCSGVQE